jgi:hemerythrin-like domain-containing protein
MRDPVALDTRTGLPDALRVLLEKHPRGEWQGHPNFDGLTRFWLERHLMFRRLQTMLLAETESGLGRTRDPRQVASQIGRLASLFVNELHGHHAIEDVHYFPALVRLEPRLERGFALLDADHHALDPMLHGLAEGTSAALRALPAATTELGRLHAELARFQTFLDRHLADEEEIIVPVILEHGAGFG